MFSSSACGHCDAASSCYNEAAGVDDQEKKSADYQRRRYEYAIRIQEYDRSIQELEQERQELFGRVIRRIEDIDDQFEQVVELLCDLFGSIVNDR